MGLNIRGKKLNLQHISWNELAKILGVALLAVAATFWIASRYIKPSPPGTVTITTGFAGSPYARFAQRYRELLADNGVKLELIPSLGASENLTRLRDPKQAVDVGFVQGGMATLSKGEPLPENTPTLVSLGSIAIEPLWVFYRPRNESQRAGQLQELVTVAGPRMGVGVVGSGTHKLATELLAASGVTAPHAHLLTQPADLAAKALARHELDVVFISAPPDATPVQEMLAIPGVQLMNFAQATAYTRRFPYLSKVTLAAGALDLANGIPSRDVDMVGTTVNLIVRDELHPALMYLLLEAATQVHGEFGLFQDRDEYPSRKGQDMPLADEAQRFFKSGKPFLQRYLPFWLANLVDRMLVLLIPVFAVLIPISKSLPDMYAYRMRARIAHWYTEMRHLEHEIAQGLTPEQTGALSDRLDDIEASIHAEKIPALDSDAYYQLRHAVDLVRDRLGRADAKAAPPLRRK